MPLLKNGVPYTLTDADKSAIRKKVGNKFPVKFKMVPELFRPDPVNKGRIIRPPGVNIVTKSVVTHEDEFVTWVYGRTFKKDKNGTLTSSDSMISFEVEMTVGSNRMDFLFFLLNCCPILKGSIHATPNTRTMFMLENIEAESAEFVDREKKEAAAIWFITGEWTENKVRKVAAAMSIPNALDKNLIGISQVQATLVSLVKKSHGLNAFMEITQSEMEMDIRAKIQELTDLNLINFSDAWYFLSFNKDQSKYEISSKICDVIVGKSPMDSLIYVLKTDKNKWEQFKSYNSSDETEEPKTTTKKKP